MPTFDFAPEDARALALLLLSWRRQTIPPRYVPAASPPVAPAEAKVAREPMPAPQIPATASVLEPSSVRI